MCEGFLNAPCKTDESFVDDAGFEFLFFFFSSRRRHTRCGRDWSSDVCSSDLESPRTSGCARSDRGRNRLFEVTRRIALPDFPRCPVVKLVNGLVQFERLNFSAVPSIELDAKLAQRSAEIAIVSDSRPLSDQPFHAFGSVLRARDPDITAGHGCLRVRPAEDSNRDGPCQRA